MGIMDFIKGELIDVIEWTDDSRDTLSYRFPDEDKEIKNGAQLIVRESQVAQFVYLGAFGDTFTPGKHTLEYRVRLNSAGRFQLPATRVEAMYAPDVFGATPNRALEVGAP